MNMITRIVISPDNIKAIEFIKKMQASKTELFKRLQKKEYDRVMNPPQIPVNC